MIIFRGPLERLEATLELCKRNHLEVLYLDKGSPHRADIPQRFWLKTKDNENVYYDSSRKEFFDDDLDGVQVIVVRTVVGAYNFKRHKARFVDLSYNDTFHELKRQTRKGGKTYCGRETGKLYNTYTREQVLESGYSICKQCERIAKKRG